MEMKDIINRANACGQNIRTEIQRTWQEKHDLLKFELEQYQKDNVALEKAIESLKVKIADPQVQKSALEKGLGRMHFCRQLSASSSFRKGLHILPVKP